jgi:DNA-binding Lrp family transcriptional regulator
MVHAFIMVKTTAGKSEALLAAILDLAPVTEAHVVAGDWDVVVEADAGEVYDVIHAVAGDVQDIDGVTDTRTYIALE